MSAFIRLIVSLTAVQWLRKTSSVWLFPIIVLCIVWLAHTEFLSFLSAAYPDASTAKSWMLGISYLLKWGVTLLAFIWIMFRSRRQRLAKRSVLDSHLDQNGSKGSSIVESKQRGVDMKDDGFDFIREKKRLESRSEKIIKGKDISDGPAN